MTGFCELNLKFQLILAISVFISSLHFMLSSADHETKFRFDVYETLCPNRCLYIKVAKLRTGVGSAEPSYLQNCSVKLFKGHFKVQIFKGR